MRVLTLTLQKGGVGKTSSTLALGAELARRGRRVLLLDLDPQANLTAATGLDLTAIGPSIYDALLNPEGGLTPIIRSTEFGFDLAPASLSLAGAELQLANVIGRELVVRALLEGVKARYDVALLDTPPALGTLTVNALVAATDVIVPLQAHALALQALPQLEDTIRRVRVLNPSLAITAILVTMLDKRVGASRQVEEAARAAYGDLILKAVIPQAARMIEAPAAGQPISFYAPSSPAAVAYAQACDELEARCGL